MRTPLIGAEESSQFIEKFKQVILSMLEAGVFLSAIFQNNVEKDDIQEIQNFFKVIAIESEI